jgi:hypothetical protein
MLQEARRFGLRVLAGVISWFALTVGTVAAQNSPTLVQAVHPPTHPACLSWQATCGRAAVQFQITVKTDGSVGNPVVILAAPSTAEVVVTAMTATVQWRYLPVPVPVSTSVIVQWTTVISIPGQPGPANLPPREPQNLQSTYVGGILTLTWMPPGPGGGAPTSYVIRAGYLPSLSNLADFDTGSLATTFSTFVPPGFPPPDTTGSSINPGGTMFLRVHARNAVGTSAASNIVNVVTGGPGNGGGRGGGGGPGCSGPPGAPSGLTMVVNGQQVSFSWGAAAGASGYLLEAGSHSGGANLTALNLGAQTTFGASAPPGTYFVRVRATNGCGQSPPSNEVVVVVGGGSAIPPGGGGDAVPAGRQWRPCAEAVPSIVLAIPVPLEFVNVSSQPRLLYWVDFGGVRRSYGVLQPGQSGFLTSFVTHSWVVTDPPGTCLGTLVLSGGGRVAIQ